MEGLAMGDEENEAFKKKCWERCGEKGTSVHCWWECKSV